MRQVFDTAGCAVEAGGESQTDEGFGVVPTLVLEYVGFAGGGGEIPVCCYDWVSEGIDSFGLRLLLHLGDGGAVFLLLEFATHNYGLSWEVVLD
jgi:hypothetical protein